MSLLFIITIELRGVRIRKKELLCYIIVVIVVITPVREIVLPVFVCLFVCEQDILHHLEFVLAQLSYIALAKACAL